MQVTSLKRLCIRTGVSSILPGLGQRSPPGSPYTPRPVIARQQTLALHSAFSAETPRGRAASFPPNPAPVPTKWTGAVPHSSGVAVLSATGRRNFKDKQHNQDAWVVEHVEPLPGQEAALIGVFDGHGDYGHYAAKHVSSAIQSAVHGAARQALASTLSDDDDISITESWDEGSASASANNLTHATALSSAAGAAALDFSLDTAQSCLQETFMRAAASCEVADCDMNRSGATAVVCLVLRDSVVAAWAGDSRAVVGSVQSGGSYTATQLTKDHKPNNLSEMARIMAAGGKVARPSIDKSGRPVGPFRVFLPGSPNSGLSVARSFGDLQLSRAGVVPTPDIAVFPRTPAPGAASSSSSSSSPSTPARPADILVVATDGLWEQLSNQEAVQIAGAAGSAEAAAHRLLDEAMARWEAQYGEKHRDDITVAVAYL